MNVEHKYGCATKLIFMAVFVSLIAFGTGVYLSLQKRRGGGDGASQQVPENQSLVTEEIRTGIGLELLPKGTVITEKKPIEEDDATPTSITGKEEEKEPVQEDEVGKIEQKDSQEDGATLIPIIGKELLTQPGPAFPLTSTGFEEHMAMAGTSTAVELSDQVHESAEDPEKEMKVHESAEEPEKEMKVGPRKRDKLSEKEIQENLAVVRKYLRGAGDLTDEDILRLVSSNKKNLVMSSVKDGNRKLTAALLNLGASFEMADHKGLYPVHVAAEKGNKAMLQLLEDQGADINKLDQAGYTILHRATLKGKAGMVKWILEKPVDINHANPSGWTALHLAASGGHVDIAKLLVEAGANVNAKDTDGWTPLYIAGLYKKQPMENYIRSVGDLFQDFGSMNTLLDSESNLSEISGPGSNLIQSFKTVQTGSSESVNEGTECGSDGVLSNNNVILQYQPQSYGSQSESNDSISNNTMSNSLGTQKVLLPLVEFTKHTQQDAQKKASGRKRLRKKTMHLALKDGNLPLVQLLLKQGASMNFTDKQGQFPTHLAAASGNIELLEILFSWGGDLSKKDLFGYTPFHRAALAGQTEIIKWLYERGGGFIKETSWAGWTALHVAAMNGHYATCLQLLELGANVNAKDKDGWTPSYLAKLYKRIAVLKLLKSWGGRL